jgi:hypothetical protein
MLKVAERSTGLPFIVLTDVMITECALPPPFIPWNPMDKSVAAWTGVRSGGEGEKKIILQPHQPDIMLLFLAS